MDHDIHHLFYSDIIDNGLIILDENETKHAQAVLRLGKMDTCYVTDGRGTVMQCRLEEFAGNKAKASIIDITEKQKPSPEIHLGVGLPEKKPFEEMLKNLPPLSIDSITPLVCEYCQRPWWERKWDKSHDRFRKKIIAASKQALNPFLTALNSPEELDEWLDSAVGSDIIIYADENGASMHEFSEKLSAHTEMLERCDRVWCLVGPPGGFSPTEISLLNSKDSSGIQLGRYRLRTELAAVALTVQVTHYTRPSIPSNCRDEKVDKK